MAQHGDKAFGLALQGLAEAEALGLARVIPGLGAHPALVAGKEAAEGFLVQVQAIASILALEMGFLELAAVTEGKHQAVGDRVAEGLQQIEREGPAAVIGLVEKTEEGVRAEGFEQPADLVHEHGIGKREQGVQGVGGGEALAPGPGKATAVEVHEQGKILAGGASLDTQEGFEGSGCLLLRLRVMSTEEYARIGQS